MEHSIGRRRGEERWSQGWSDKHPRLPLPVYVPLSPLPPPVLPTAAAAPFVRGLLNYGAAFLLPRGSEIGSRIGERKKREKKRSILGMLEKQAFKGGGKI